MKIKPYFWMKLAHWLGCKIIIRLNGKKGIGYLGTPKNQLGKFYLESEKSNNAWNIIMYGKTNEVEYASFFWGFFFNKSTNDFESFIKNNSRKEDSSRLISELPVSICVPVDGNIARLELPPVKILDVPKPWENKSERNH